jgi:hypothetical protein
MKGWTAFDDVRKRWRRSTDGAEARVAERGITLTFTSGAQVVLPEEEATWLRDELLRGEFKSPNAMPASSSTARSRLSREMLNFRQRT